MTFGAVGVTNTLISLCLYSVLIALGTSYLVAAPVAFGAGALNGYVLNARFTFRHRRTRRSLARYVLVQLLAAALSDGLVWLLSRATGEHLAAYAATLLVVSLASFVASRRWVFVAGRTVRTEVEGVVDVLGAPQGELAAR